MRYLALLAALLVGCGGGGAPEINLTHNGQIETIYATGTGPKLTLRYGLQFVDFFKCVPNGHAGVMTHADLSRIPSGNYRGVGLIYGMFGDSTQTHSLPQLTPLAVMETWGDGKPILAETVSERIQDGPVYSVEVTTEGNNVGYSIDGFHVDAVDANPFVNQDENAIAFYSAAVGDCSYSIRIFNPTATRSAA